MLIDAETLRDGARIEADVAVVGAGPGGIVVALELAHAGLDVALLESGRPRFCEATQRLADAASFDPARHAPMDEATRRQIGGASVIWGGRCVPYDPVDFDDRPWIDGATWPVTYEELLPWFQRANDYFFCGEACYDLHGVPGVEQTSIVPGLPDDQDAASSTLERWSLPTDFGREYRQDLEREPRIRLCYGVTITRIDTAEGADAVTGLAGRTLGGKAITVRARRYVLAGGGVETTRLLLASDTHHHGGVGNHSGHLGRYYMGHLSGQIARVCFDGDPNRTVYGFDRDADGVYLRRRLSITRDKQHAEQITNVVSWLVNPKIWDASHRNGVLSFAYLALTAPVVSKYFAPAAIRKAAAGQRRQATLPHLANMARDLPRTLAFIPSFGYKRFVPWRRVPGFFQYSASNSYPLHYHAEQVPNPDSRVRLSGARDALGMRRVDLDLRFVRQDVDGVLRSHEIWDAWLRRHGKGRLDYFEADAEARAASVWEQAADGFHQCGTTRMSASPADGVVDAQCAVHGFDDLYVASSSTFTTSGQANSTFMIVVFGLRLAAHLAEQLR